MKIAYDPHELARLHGGEVIGNAPLIMWRHNGNVFNRVGYCDAIKKTVDQYVQDIKGGSVKTKKHRERTTAPAAPALPVVEMAGTIPMPEGWSFRPSDLSNSQIFAALAAGRVVYIPEVKSWHTFDGRRWRPDPQRVEVEKICTEVIQSVYALSATAGTEGERKLYAAWALKSEDEARRRAMVAGAERIKSMVKQLSDFDRDPWLLNGNNGTLDLRSGELRPHNREDYLLKIAPVDYDPKASCPLWEATVKAALSGKTELINFYQKYSGYTLTGITSEQTILFLYGKRGANGKSTITKAEQEIMGDYACKIGIDTLLSGKRNPGGPSEDLARLAGIRRATVSEPPDNGSWNDALLKDLSGGDPMNARHLRAASFDFDPQLKLVIFGNHKPRLRGSSEALRRRFRLINFAHRFEKPDKKMPEKLRAEYPGILRWMVQGCITWQKEGLTEPDEVRMETDKYFYENNLLRQYLDENYVATGKDADRVKFADFHSGFTEFTGAKISKPKLSASLRDDFNLEVVAGSGNRREITGLQIKPDNGITPQGKEKTGGNTTQEDVFPGWDDLARPEDVL